MPKQDCGLEWPVAGLKRSVSLALHRCEREGPSAASQQKGAQNVLYSVETEGMSFPENKLPLF